MSDPRLYEWLALRRIHDGGVAKSAGVYLDHGRPVSSRLTELFEQLIWAGLVVVGEGDPLWELRRLSLTPAGQAGTRPCPSSDNGSPCPCHPPGSAPGRPPGPRPTVGQTPTFARRVDTVPDSPDVVIGMRLLDAAKRHGFRFELIAQGPDGPLWGVRDTENWNDTIYIGGFSAGCSATRRRKSSLIVPGDLLVAERVSGDALNVLNTVVSHWPA